MRKKIWRIGLCFAMLVFAVNVAFAQSELRIEDAADGERLTETIAQYTQLGENVEYAAADQAADIQIMTYAQMQKAAAEGEILPLEIEGDAPAVLYAEEKPYGCAIKTYKTWFLVQNPELWESLGLEIPQGVIEWSALLEIAGTVDEHNSETGDSLLLLANASRFANSPLFEQSQDAWLDVSQLVSAEDQTALLKEAVLALDEIGSETYVTGIRYEDQTYALSQPEVRSYVISAETQSPELAQRFMALYADHAGLGAAWSGLISDTAIYDDLYADWAQNGSAPSRDNFEYWLE